MESLLVTLLVLVLIFCLVWWLIGILPLPEPLAKVKWVFYAVLVIFAVIVLLRYVNL